MRTVETIQFRNQVDEARRTCCVPVKYSGASLEEVSQVPPACRDRPAIVALIGGRGPGKTHMGCALINRFVQAGRSARYITAMDYIAAVRATWDRHSHKSEYEVIREFTRLKLLVVDEMQERGDTPSEDRLLTQLVDKRYANQGATVLISNQTEEKFVDRIGVSIASRINDGGGIMTCDWGDIREWVSSRRR